MYQINQLYFNFIQIMLLLQDNKPQVYISDTGGSHWVMTFIDYIDVLLDIVLIPLLMVLIIFWTLLLYFFCERFYLKYFVRSTINGE